MNENNTAVKNGEGKQNGLSLKLIKYELKNMTSNIFVVIFGVIFPIFMAMLFGFIIFDEIAAADAGYNAQRIYAMLFILFSGMIPLATMFIGHAENYALELESGVIQRMKLFGFSERTMLAAKLIANTVFLTGALIIYFAVLFIAFDMAAPTAAGIFTLIIYLYAFAVVLMVLSHAIATLCGRFSLTFGITMGMYFLFLVLGGMMGANPAQFPAALRYLSMALPMYYVTTYMIDLWTGEPFSFLGLSLSMLGFAIASAGLLVFSVWFNKKGGRNNGDPKPVYYD